MKKLKIYILLAVCLPLFLSAKDWRMGMQLSNNVVSFPVTGLPQTAYTQFHPGIDFFVEHQFNKHTKNQLWMQYDLGVYYHRFFQTGLRMFATVEYRRAFSERFSANVGISMGYLHSIPDYDRFKLNSVGEYEKVSNIAGRAQFLAGFGIGVSYGILKKDPQKIRLMLNFKSFIQTPFASSYVPILPTNGLFIGASMPFSTLFVNHKNEKK